MSAQTGSGMAVRSRNGSHLLSARIGTPQNREFRYGFSLAYGRVLESRQSQTYPLPELIFDEPVLKRRVGLDMQYLMGAFEFKGEAAYGKDDDEEVFGVLPQVDFVVSANKDVKIIMQGNYWSNDITKGGKDDLTLGVGLSWKLKPSWDMRIGYFHDLKRALGEEDAKALLQFYYFGE